ncbi:MAG: hypothetical protein IJS89_00725 [Bacteroidaceae bacterium]|nr:hypothetical protein [Bacteroidaceae bacterium]
MKKVIIAVLAALLLFPMAADAQRNRRTPARRQTTQSGLTALERKVVGKHMLSLQWISWEYFGTCTITKQADGTLRCKGEQLSRGDDSHIGDYLKIDGTVRIVSALELEFTGTIRTKIYHINGGEEVLREGTFTFLSTNGRKYWRLQQMKNPADECTDYVDIYFK